MNDAPKTLEEAQSYRYNKWVGNPKGILYCKGRCAYEVYDTYLPRQCLRKPRYGPDGLYCKQHAKMVKSND